MTDIPFILPAAIGPVPEVRKVVPTLHRYELWAYWLPGEWWHQKGDYQDRAGAERRAKELAHGWVSPIIVEVEYTP